MTLLTRLQIWGAPYLRALLWLIRHLHPLSKARALSFIHFAHFSVLKGLQPAGGARDGSRQSNYLLFESNFNGIWQEYIEAFCQVINTDINALMTCAEGFPGLMPARGFREFMEHHELTANHYYSAYPEQSATVIRAAQELEPRLARLARIAARKDDDQFADAWQEFLAQRQVQANLGGEACQQPNLLAYLRQILFARKNVAENVYVFIALTPVSPDRLARLREYLHGLPLGASSPLAAVPGTHFGRWVLLDQVYHDSWPEPLEILDPACLLFTAVFDRTSRDPVGTYLRQALTALGQEADAIWGHCAEWPVADQQDARVAYLRRYQRDADFVVAGYPGSVSDVRQAVANRAELVAFVRQAQELARHRLRDAFSARSFVFADSAAESNLGAQR